MKMTDCRNICCNSRRRKPVAWKISNIMKQHINWDGPIFGKPIQCAEFTKRFYCCFICFPCWLGRRSFNKWIQFSLQIFHRWSGISVGSGSASGQRVLNRCQSERDKASAMLFIFPGICSAFNMILYCKDSETRFLTRVITLLDFEDFLLIIATTAWLSTLKIIRLFFKCITQMCTEMTTGNNSKNVISTRIPLSAHYCWPTNLSPFTLKINAEPFISPTGPIRKQTNCLIRSPHII